MPNFFGLTKKWIAGIQQQKRPIWEVSLIFLKLGILAFGGPAAHIAMMENEFVQKRQWLDRTRFLELVGASNLIPGPTSTELAIYLGYLRAGWPGLILAGTFFILPAMVIVLLLARVYVYYGTLPQVALVLYGIKPVIIAIIIQAVWKLGKAAVKDAPGALTSGLALVLSFLALNPLLVLITSGMFVIAIKRLEKLKANMIIIPISLLATISMTTNQVAQSSTVVKLSMTAMFLIFLKIGAIVYGSGYVLLPFLWTDFVQNYQVLTSQQLLDAVAIGQFTPGPVFTTATFIGYIIAGIPGAIISTIAIFLPSFIFVPFINAFLGKIKTSVVASDFLGGVIVASLALMVSVTWTLTFSSIVDWMTGVIAVVSVIAIFKYNLNTSWLIVVGGLIGLFKFFTG